MKGWADSQGTHAAGWGEVDLRWWNQGLPESEHPRPGVLEDQNIRATDAYNLNPLNFFSSIQKGLRTLPGLITRWVNNKGTFFFLKSQFTQDGQPEQWDLQLPREGGGRYHL